MPKKWYPTRTERKAMNMKTRNRRVAIELKQLCGLIRYFQEPEKRVANGR